MKLSHDQNNFLLDAPTTVSGEKSHIFQVPRTHQINLERITKNNNLKTGSFSSLGSC